VLRDPNSLGTEADLHAQFDFLTRLRAELDEVADMINHLERTRRQVEDFTHTFSSGPKAAAAAKAAADFEAQVVAVEGELFDVHLTGQTEDSFRHAMMLYGKLANLDAELSGSGADLPPTDQQKQVYAELAAHIAQARDKVHEVAERNTAAFNQWLKANGFAAAIEP
jgi:hypothetical protein